MMSIVTRKEAVCSYVLREIVREIEEECVKNSRCSIFAWLIHLRIYIVNAIAYLSKLWNTNKVNQMVNYLS